MAMAKRNTIDSSAHLEVNQPKLIDDHSTGAVGETGELGSVPRIAPHCGVRITYPPFQHQLARTKERRDLSRTRYHRAEDFFVQRTPTTRIGWHHFLYRSGISAQLAISSHLLDVGFDDDWCARNIGLQVAKSLACANQTGFGYSNREMDRLAIVLTPYNKWNNVWLSGEKTPSDGGFDVPQVSNIIRDLLEHVRLITGHPRPRGWKIFQEYSLV